MEKAELLSANPEYAFVRLKSGFETTVSIRDLAPCTRDTRDNEDAEEEDDEYDNVHVSDAIHNMDASPMSPPASPHMTSTQVDETSTQDYVTPTPILESTSDNQVATNDDVGEVRRSSRKRQAPEKFCDSKYSYVGMLGFSCR